ncbi:MAG: DUF4962 domain-containing protein [Planctomycetota bacterium]|nr:DUF4962 domain-containing protein [Planctomycetota bacterium]
MTKYLCILMVLVLCFASTSEAKGGKRPRMLVTPGTLEALRDKAEGAGSDEFAAIKARADAMMNMKAELDNQGRFYLPTYALVYLVTKEEKYASKAKEWFDLLAGHTIRNEWTCLEYIPVSAFAYDWIFPTLTEDEKRRFADGMIRQVERIKKLWRHSDYNNHFLLEHSSQLHVGLTLEGEGHHEDVWRKYLDEGEVWLKNHIVPAMNEMALDDGGCAEGFSYMNWGVERPLALQILAWKTAKGEDLFKKCSFTRWGSRYNIYGRKPNGEMCRTEDCPSGIEWGQQVKGTLSICAAAYGNQYAAWARDSIKAKYPNLSWHHFVPWNPSIQPKSPEGLPLGAVFRGLGHVFTRSSWTDPDSTWGMFQCGPFFAGHQHLDNNSFVIFKSRPACY